MTAQTQESLQSFYPCCLSATSQQLLVHGHCCKHWPPPCSSCWGMELITWDQDTPLNFSQLFKAYWLPSGTTRTSHWPRRWKEGESWGSAGLPKCPHTKSAVFWMGASALLPKNRDHGMGSCVSLLQWKSLENPDFYLKRECRSLLLWGGQAIRHLQWFV